MVDPGIRVFIYSSSSVVASSLALLLQESAHFETSSGADKAVLFNGLKNSSYDIVILYDNPIDSAMFEFINSNRDCLIYGSSAKIVVFGNLKNDYDLLTLIKMGVLGYFRGGISLDSMVFYLKNIHKGIPFYSMRVLGPLIKKILDENQELVSASFTESELLTKREMTLLHDICRGDSIEEISQKHFISKSTVKNHLSSIYRKMGVHNRSQALLTAIRGGLYIPE